MIYIDPAGVNSPGNGTEADPYLTLQYAMQQNAGLGPGLVFNINPGSYTWSGFGFNLNGLVENRCTIRATNPFDPPAITMTGGPLRIEGDNVTVSRLAISGCAAGALQIGNWTSARCDNPIIDRCWIYENANNAGGSISPTLIQYGLNVIFRNCVWWSNRTYVPGAGLNSIYSNRSIDGMRIENCVIMDPGANCIQFDETSTGVLRDVEIVDTIGMAHNQNYGPSNKPWLLTNPSVSYSFDRVGEMFLGGKRITGTVAIRRCAAYGFIVNQEADGGDVGGGSRGPMMVILLTTAGRYEIHRFEGWRCGSGIQIYEGDDGVVIPDVRIYNTLLHSFLPAGSALPVSGAVNAGRGISIRDCASVTVQNCAVLGAYGDALLLQDANVALIRNVLIANDGNFVRNTGVTGEGNISYLARYSNDNTIPSQWNSNEVTISDFSLDSMLYPIGDNDVLGAGGTISAFFTALDRQNHATPPDLYPMPTAPVWASRVLWQLNITRKYIDGQFTSMSNSLDGLKPWPVPDTEDNCGISCWTDGATHTTAQFATRTITASPTIRLTWGLILDAFAGVNTNEITIYKFYDESVAALAFTVGLRYVTDAWNLVISVYDNAQDETFVLTTTGTVLSRSDTTISIDWAASTGPGNNNGYMLVFVDDVEIERVTGLVNDTLLPDQFQLGLMTKNAEETYPNNIGSGDYVRGHFLLHDIVIESFDYFIDDPVTPPSPSTLLFRITHEGGDTAEYTSTVGTVAATARCDYESLYGLEHSPDGNNYGQYDLNLGAIERFNVATFINLNNLTSPQDGDVMRFVEGYGPTTSLFYLQATIQADTDLATIGVYYWNGSAYTHLSAGNVDRAGEFDGFIHVEANILSAATDGSIQLFINGLTAGTVTGLSGLDAIAEAMTSLRVGAIGNSNGMGGWVCQDFITISTLQQVIGPYLGGGGPAYGHGLMSEMKVGFISKAGRKPRADWFTGRR